MNGGVRSKGKEVPTVGSGSELGCSYSPIRVPKPHPRILKLVFCKVHTSGSPGPPCWIGLFLSKGKFGFSSRKMILQNI